MNDFRGDEVTKLRDEVRRWRQATLKWREAVVEADAEIAFWRSRFEVVNACLPQIVNGGPVPQPVLTSWGEMHARQARNWRDRARLLEEKNKSLSAILAMTQALLDPENQPSRWTSTDILQKIRECNHAEEAG